MTSGSIDVILIAKGEGGSTIHIECGHVFNLIIEECRGDAGLDLSGAAIQCAVEEALQFDLGGLGGLGGWEEV